METMQKPIPVKPIIIDDTIITDKAIEEIFPKEDEIVLEPAPLSEAEVEEAIGGDMPAEGVSTTNMNIEDEELEKEEDPI